MVLQYGDSGRSFPKDSIFACKTKSVCSTRAKTNIWNSMFRLVLFVELKLLWNR